MTRTRVEAITASGLSGFLATPAAGGVAAVIVFGGSEGGAHENDARVLADEGFEVMALAYFGAPGIPPALQEIPLEYFFGAVEHLKALGHLKIGIVGGSRGAEAALLVGAHDSRVSAVVSVVGSGVVTPGIDFRLGDLEQILNADATAWTLNGLPLPGLKHDVKDSVRATIAAGKPLRLAETFADLPGSRCLEEISIPVERIQGPVLLISASDDGMWDSTAYSETAADRLRRSDHPYPWEHVVMKGAGHTIAGAPGAPFTTSTTPGPGVVFEMGGEPSITTAAREAAWDLTVAFFDQHLR
jgi:dienelactone hydrolase